MKQKNTCIKFIDNKCFIQITNPISNKTFDLIWKIKEKDLYSRVNCLETIIYDQSQIIKQQNEKIISLEERLKKLEEIIPQYNKLKQGIEQKLMFESEILNKEEQEMLINWLPRKPNKITLLLNSNRDGDSTVTFLDKCGGKCPTLAVIKTTNGYVFGGYTTQIWKAGQTRDENAFVFSIDKKKKYRVKEPETAIGYGKQSWWGFGYSNNAIVVLENCTKNNGSWVDNGTYDIPEKYELNGGEKNFTVKSFEIYHVDY